MIIEIIEFLIIIILLLVILWLLRKNAKVRKIKPVSDIYLSIHRIDLEKDSFEEISCSDEAVRSLIGKKRSEAQKTLLTVIDKLMAERSKKKMTEFAELTTLEKRLEDNGTITEEFLDHRSKWCRARFIVESRNDLRKVKTVLWLIESIDREKRNKDNQRLLSEIDEMTGIYNRAGGERKINEILENGARGMFILLDADNFRAINERYGSETGDRIIMIIADAMKRTFRDSDVIMRLGGDEFAAYVSDIDTTGKGRVIVERFIANVGQISIPRIPNSRVAVSVGAIIHAIRKNVTFSELYTCADQATYESKRREGSCITFYNEII